MKIVAKKEPESKLNKFFVIIPIMTIFLVRHTAFYNPENVFAFHLPYYLSEEGRQQATETGSWFKSQNLLNLPIFTSPIVRCLQTAEIIASKTGSFVLTDEKLTETYCPELQGNKQPLENAWQHEEHHPSRESRKSVLERVTKSFEDRINAGKDCLMVSHGDQLTILYYYLIKKEAPYYFWDEKVSSEKVFRRGEIMKVEIENKELLSIDRIVI